MITHKILKIVFVIKLGSKIIDGPVKRTPFSVLILFYDLSIFP